MASSGMRDHILTVAVRLLREQGMNKVSQAQVAREAGVPQGHLTYYFPRKGDLLAAVAQRTIDMIGSDVAQFVAGAGWPAEGASAREQALAVVESTIKDSTRTRMLLGLVLEASEDEDLRDRLTASASAVRALLARGMGRDPSDLDVEIMLATFWGLGITHLLHQGRRSDRHTEALVARLPTLFASLPAPASPPSATAKRSRPAARKSKRAPATRATKKAR